ncbi:MAG: hypothetical protein ACRCXK_04080 [Wohlfahrtiimonas sp.]
MLIQDKFIKAFSELYVIETIIFTDDDKNFILRIKDIVTEIEGKYWNEINWKKIAKNSDLLDFFQHLSHQSYGQLFPSLIQALQGFISLQFYARPYNDNIRESILFQQLLLCLNFHKNNDHEKVAMLSLNQEQKEYVSVMLLEIIQRCYPRNLEARNAFDSYWFQFSHKAIPYQQELLNLLLRFFPSKEKIVIAHRMDILLNVELSEYFHQYVSERSWEEIDWGYLSEYVDSEVSTVLFISDLSVFSQFFPSWMASMIKSCFDMRYQAGLVIDGFYDYLTIHVDEIDITTEVGSKKNWLMNLPKEIKEVIAFIIFQIKRFDSTCLSRVYRSYWYQFYNPKFEILLLRQEDFHHQLMDHFGIYPISQLLCYEREYGFLKRGYYYAEFSVMAKNLEGKDWNTIDVERFRHIFSTRNLYEIINIVEIDSLKDLTPCLLRMCFDGIKANKIDFVMALALSRIEQLAKDNVYSDLQNKFISEFLEKLKIVRLI